MAESKLDRAIRLRQAATRDAVRAEVQRVIDASGLSLRALAAGTGVDHGQLSRFLAGKVGLSQDALVAVATGLGCDVSVRPFEAVGPRLRDHLQARMIEALLAVLQARWLARLEVAVYRPVRGVIDVVLQDRETWDVVAGEGHSGLRSAEQQLRWAGGKADSLDSAKGWPWAPPGVKPSISRLLVLRSCAANHQLVASLPETFRAAYPAPTEAAVEALRTGTRPWPGAAILWVDIDGADTRLLAATPRAAVVGPRSG